MSDRETVYKIRFDVSKAQGALVKFNKGLERTYKLVVKIEKSGKSMFNAMRDGGRKSERVFKKVENSMRKAERGTRKVGKAALNASAQMKRIGTSAKTSSIGVGALIAKVGVFIGVAQGVRVAVTEFLSFDDTMTIAAAKFATLDENMAVGKKGFIEMREHVRALSKETELSAAETAKAVDFWAKAGKTFTQTKAVLPVTLDFASAIKVAGEEADVGRAGDILSDVLGQFKLGSDDPATLMANTARIADVMSKAANTANLSASELFGAFQTGGPILNTAGQTIEQVAAYMATLADAGIKGTKAGRMMKTATVSLTSPSKMQIKLLEKLNIETKDMDGNFRGITALIGDIDRATKHLGTGDRTEVFAKLVGREGIVALINLLNKGEDALGKMTEKLEDAKGSSEALAKAVRESASAGLQKLKNRFIDLAFELLENTKLIDKLTRVLEIVYDVVVKTAKYLNAVFGPAIRSISKLFGNLGGDSETLTTILGLLAAAFIVVKGLQGIGGLLAIGPKMLGWFATQGAAATTLTLKMGVLAKSITGVFGALAAGYAAGTWFSKTFLEPHSKKKREKNWTREEHIKHAQKMLESGTYEQKRQAQFSLGKQDIGSVKGEWLDRSVEDIAGDLMAPFTGAETTMGRLVRQKQTMGDLSGKLAKSMRNTSVSNMITINAPGGDARAIGREVEKAISKKIRRGAQGVGASEQ